MILFCPGYEIPSFSERLGLHPIIHLLVNILVPSEVSIANSKKFYLDHLTFLLTRKSGDRAVMRCWWGNVLFLFNAKVASDSSMSGNSIASQKESSWQEEDIWVKWISQASKQKPWQSSWGEDERIKSEDKKNGDLKQHTYTHLYTAVTELFSFSINATYKQTKKSIQFSVSEFMYKNISLWQ